MNETASKMADKYQRNRKIMYGSALMIALAVGLIVYYDAKAPAVYLAGIPGITAFIVAMYFARCPNCDLTLMRASFPWGIDTNAKQCSNCGAKLTR
jgi:hypothetical protein